MKKLLLIVFIAGFVGLAFAFSPAKVTTTSEQTKISLMDDTTKTTKATTTTTKEDCTKKSCCKNKCSTSTKTTDKPKK